MQINHHVPRFLASLPPVLLLGAALLAVPGPAAAQTARTTYDRAQAQEKSARAPSLPWLLTQIA